MLKIGVFTLTLVLSLTAIGAEEFSVDELFNKSISESFDTRVEFEHVEQARLLAKNAYLRLTPHITLTSVLSIISLNAASMIGSIGDLAPFLLPNRWLLAKESSHRSNAEQYAHIAIRADAGTVVEGLAIMVLRDQEILAKLQAYSGAVTAIRDEIKFREVLGQLQTGSSDDISVI